MAMATLLLPERRRFAGRGLPDALARALGRADPVAGGEAGERAQLLRHFTLLPRTWPAAALTRQLDAGDAAASQWLRADPAWVRPELNGARLLACGEGLQLEQEDVDALLPALRPLFGDAGFPIDAPRPSRWYLRLPQGASVPDFVEPDDALGADLFDSLVGTETATSAGNRRWRALLSEAQVVLHNHPWNARRAAAGKSPVNSLWFWGGGKAPDHVATAHAQVHGGDAMLQALARGAGVPWSARGPRFQVQDANALWDLRGLRDPSRLFDDWLSPAVAAIRDGGLQRLRLDFGDGDGYVLARTQRWRLWRRPLRELAPVQPRRPAA
ncbi:phosphoglycerate mutase [Luteimonas sp. 50]|uniref:Phosphoglycerate mutase n=1 Tax=Cognatiluteimonas sedimenti TaxID=2927791 RepID=A0ABT0A1M0_9GAMM|nr:phosphoglycerate mutase [Lysobacter sedimenti]MCJ0824843.1 phosphoglycerate mutase [Lysobacter sedimenti]